MAILIYAIDREFNVSACLISPPHVIQSTYCL